MEASLNKKRTRLLKSLENVLETWVIKLADIPPDYIFQCQITLRNTAGNLTIEASDDKLFTDTNNNSPENKKEGRSVNWEPRINKVKMKDCHRVNSFLRKRIGELAILLVDAIPKNLRKGWCHKDAMAHFIFYGYDEFIVLHATEADSPEKEKEYFEKASEEIGPYLKAWKQFGVTLSRFRYHENLQGYVACLQFK